MDGLAKMICTNCYVGTFADHQELNDWKKCQTCGKCEKKDLEKRERLLERQKDKEYK